MQDVEHDLAEKLVVESAETPVVESAETPVAESAEPVDAKQADAVNGDLSQVDDSNASSQYATPMHSGEFDKPLPDDGRKRYSRTFLYGIAPHCKDLPPQIEMATLSALQWQEGMGERPLGPPREFCIIKFICFYYIAVDKR